jgi:hypothetical protein
VYLEYHSLPVTRFSTWVPPFPFPPPAPTDFTVVEAEALFVNGSGSLLEPPRKKWFLFPTPALHLRNGSGPSGPWITIKIPKFLKLGIFLSTTTQVVVYNSILYEFRINHDNITSASPLRDQCNADAFSSTRSAFSFPSSDFDQVQSL